MANNKRVVWDEKSHSFVDSGPSTTAEQKRVTWDEKSHSFIDNGPSTPARQAEQTATTTNTRSQFDVSPTPYFSREQQAAAPTRLQQLAAETVQQKNERQSFPTATESTPIRSRRDMLLNSYQQQINNVNDLYDKYNGNLENLSEEDAKTIQNYRDSYSRLQQYGGYDELKKQQEEDAANDRKYAAQLRGVNVDEMSALERAGGTLGGMASAAAKQTGVSALGNVTHLMNTGALKADAEYSPAMKQVATMLFYGLMDEPDSAGNEMIAEQLRTMAAYIGGDAYGDAVVNRIRERAAQARETDQYDVNNLLTDIEYDQDYQWRKMQEQIESTGIYDTMQNLSNSAAEDIQYAKDVNLLQSKFGDQIVEAGVSAISNMGDAALASLLGLSGGGALAMIPFALRSYGGSYAEALENARAMGEEIRKDTVQKADKYASLSTAIEVGTEMIWGITGIMGNVTNGGALDDYTMSALTNAIKNFKMSDAGKKILSRIGELAIGGMTEGLEELIGDAANYILNTAGIMNGEERGDFDWSEASNSFIVGMLAAFIGEPVAVVSNKFQTAKTGKDLRSGKAKDFLGGNMTAAELVESASAAKENTELSKTLQDLIRKYGGEDYSSVLQKATNTELGRLYEAYENTMQEEFDSRELVTNAVDKAEVAKSGELPTSYARRIVKDENAMQYLADSGYEINSDLSYKEKIDEVKAAVEALASARTAFQDMEAENSKLGIENSSKRQLEDRLYNANNWQQSVGQKMAEAEMQNVNAVRDAAQSINMGQMGMETLQANYDGRQDPTAYVNAMDQAYELGRFGGELDTSKLSNNAVGLEQQRNAFIAGRADRISEQEANNAGQEIRLRNGGERNDSQGTVRQAGILESGAGQNQVGQAGYRQGEVRNAKVSSAAISEKSIAATGLKIVSNSSDKDVTAAREYAQSHGMNFVAWYGGSLWIDGVQSRGFYDPKTNTVYVRAGHALFTAEQISKHETTHGLINNGTIALGDVNGRDTVVGFRTVRDALVEKIGADKFSELVDKYVEAYAGTGMSQQEIFEEMICDAVAGMNEFVSQGHMEEAFRQQASLQAAKAVTEENAANGKRAGPSMDAFSKYSAEIVSANVEYDFGTTQQDINEYVDKAYKNVDQIDYKKYAKVDDRLANDVGDDFTDIREYAHALRNNDIRHIRNSHGETKNEKYPVTANDQKSIPSIVENYDKVFYVKKNGRSGLYYIKVVEDNLVYYLEAATAIYGNEKLLVNKQMIKTGVDDLLNIPELEAAINKKQTTAEFLADLEEIHKVYARSVYQQRSVSNSTIAEDNGVVKQNISSAGTSLNQVPALHKDSRIEWGDTNIDIGAGANVVTYKHGDEDDRLAKVNSIKGSRFSRELDNFLQEQYPEYRTDKENLRLAEEGIRQLEEGSRRISDAEGVSTTERTGERSTDGRRSGSDIRTLGRGITKRFIQSGRVNLNGTKVKTTEDVARMCQIFRNPQFETARYIYVRNGKVVGMDAVSSRLPGLSLTLSSKDFDQDDLIKKIRRVKADGYYMMHNHPSGNVTPSGADIAATRKTSAGLSLAGIKMLGHVIIDHEVYSTIDWQGNVEKHGLQGQGSLDLLNIPEIDNENLGAQIRGQDDVAKLAKGLTGDDVSVVVYANAQGKVIQIQEISNKTLKHNSQIVGHIRNQIRETGGQMTFLYTKDEGVFNKMYPAYADGVFLDLMRDSESDFISARQYAPPRRDMYLGYSSNNLPVYVNEENIKYSRELGTSELYEQNRQLRSDLSEMRRQLEQKTKSRDYWRGQTKTTEGRRLRQDDVEKLARNVIKDQNSSADAKAVSEKLKALGEYLLNSQEDMDVVYDNARLQAYEIAHDIAAEAKVLKETDGEDFFDDFKYRLKQKKIYVPMSVRNELAVDDWNGWRNSLRGKMTLTATKEGNATIDQLYQDLRAEFGDWLLPEDIANEANQLNRILEVYETYQPVYEHLNSYDMAEAVEYIANDLLGRVIGDEIRETHPTYADRMEKRLADQKTKSQAALKRVRQNRDQRVADLKQHYQEVAERRREKRIDSAERTRLLQIARRLNNKKLTRVQRSLLNQYIGELDLVAKSITGHTINDLQALQLWYDSWAASQGEDFIRDAYIEKKLERLSKRHISDMTQEEVADLTTVLLNFENEIRTANELIESQVKIDRYAAGEQTINNIRNSDGRPTIFDKYIASETVTPEREIRKITGYEDSDPLYQVTKELSKGQRDMLDYTRIAEARFKKWTENKAFTKRIAGKNAEEITVTGLVDGAPVSVKITPAMRMSLYLHAKNDDNMSHIAHGGIKIPDMTLYKKGKMQEAYDKAKRVVFTRSMINEITAHMTSEERAFADAASRYYNTMSRDAINDVSEKLKGYAIAGVENYYPIDTDGSFLKKEFDAIKRDGSIEGMGILKERLAGATTPIMLYDMNTTLNKSISQHARYYGLAIPVRNFNKLYGVTLRNYETSVSEAIRQEWSSSANKYIEKMMADVQNGTGLQKDVWGEALAKARSKYAGAVLTTNASVMFKQAASYPTAAAVVGYGPLMKALKDVSKLDLEKFAQYTPLLWYRSKGFSTAELGDIGKEGWHIPKTLNWIQAMDVATTTKLVKAAMYYVNENSDLTRGSDAWYKEVATVYNRIIEETQPNYTMMQRPQILRSDSDLTRALNMFRTQPFQNFNILYDAFGNLKAKERQYKASGTPAALEALKEARKTAARAVSSQLLSAFVFSLIQFGWDRFRGKDKKYKDEDGELTLASWLKGMGINVLSSGGGMIPFGSYMLELGEAMIDAVSKALGGKAIFDQKFYGLSENAAESVNDMGNALINIVTKITQTLSSGGGFNESTIRSLVDSAADIAQFVGIPASNVVKLVQSIARNYYLGTESDKYMGQFMALRVTTDPKKYKSDYYALLLKSLQESPESYEKLYDEMVNDKDYVSGQDMFATESKSAKENIDSKIKEWGYNILEDAWRNAPESFDELRDRMINLYGDPFATSTKTASENIDAKVKEWKKEDAEKDKMYQDALTMLKMSNIYQQASDKQKESVEDQLLNIVAGTDDKLLDKANAAKKVGMDETEYLLFKLALSMVNEDGSGTTNKELLSVINDGNYTDDQKAFLWKTSSGLDQKKINDVVAGGKSVGLTETEYMLYKMALTMVDQPNESGKYGSYTTEEVKAAIKSMYGLTNDERAYLWEAQGLSKKTNPFNNATKGTKYYGAVGIASRQKSEPKGYGEEVYKTGEGLNEDEYGISEMGIPTERRRELDSSLGAEFYRSVWKQIKDIVPDVPSIEWGRELMETLANERIKDYKGLNSDYQYGLSHTPTREHARSKTPYDRLYSVLEYLANVSYDAGEEAKSDEYVEYIQKLNSMRESEIAELNRRLKALGF